MKSKKHRHIAMLSIAVAGVSCAGEKSNAQVAVNVSVTPSSPITYANGAAIATMPATGLGLCTSVYANMWGDPNLPGDIAASGVQTLRYPGGSYSDIYNWSLNTANEGGYVGANANIGNFFNVINAAGTQAMITVNYGSNTTATMGAQPQEAAAEVAYADASAGIYGTNSDVNLGADAASVNWYTAGYWAKLRASTPAQYQAWATAAGDYNPAYSFLAINHPAPENIQYWEIGNEIGGNGYNGPQWEYDLHAPYYQGNVNSNIGRVGNPALSPTAYAQNLVQFATLMKDVDPNIKIGAGFDAEANSTGDAAILQAAGNYIDFGIIHWYPTGSLPTMITSTLPQEIANLRTSVANNTSKGYNGIQIDVTEFGDGNSSPPTIENALFAADAYATGFENGLQNMNFQEMSSSHYLNGNGTAGNPGEVYYAIQMLSKFATTGDTFVNTSSNNSSLRIHAVTDPDGSISLLLINDGTTSADNVSINLNDALPSGSNGTLYLFGNSNIGASSDTAPTTQTLTNLTSSISVSIPMETIGTLVIPVQSLSWNNAGGSGNGSTWDTTSQNWHSGSLTADFTNGPSINFIDTNNGHYAVTLNTSVSPKSISVSNSMGNYTISGTGMIGGTGSLTKSGSGSLTLDTVNTYSGGTAVSAGRLLIEPTGPTTSALPAGALSISGSGIVQLADNVTAGTALATSNVNLTSLSLTGNGTLDIGNNRIIVHYGGGPDPIASIAHWVENGYYGMPGLAIISSDVATDDALSGLQYGIGYADGADGVVAGLPSGEIEIMYTLLGDANLDGTVNIEDFTPFSTNFGQNGGWDHGDFNYDGTVNSEDFTLFSANLNRSASLAAQAGVLEAIDVSLMNVPEPACMEIIAIAGLGILHRRRRKH